MKKFSQRSQRGGARLRSYEGLPTKARAEAERFLRDLGDRVRRFGLELHRSVTVAAPVVNHIERVSRAGQQHPGIEIGAVVIVGGMQPVGSWHSRELATAEGGGVYGLDLNPPDPGSYRLAVVSISLGTSFSQSPQYFFQVLSKHGNPGTPGHRPRSSARASVSAGTWCRAANRRYSCEKQMRIANI